MPGLKRDIFKQIISLTVLMSHICLLYIAGSSILRNKSTIFIDECSTYFLDDN